MQLCPVCAWEDAPGEAPYNGSNELSLVQAQRRFLTDAACEEGFLSVVRQPLEEEARSADWMSFDDLKLKVIRNIEKEFRNVKRDGGTTLHQMDLRDSFLPLLESEMKDAERRDPEISWQEISPSKLSRFSQSLTFLDDLGYRFYLLAFMRHGLQTSYPDIGMADLDGVLWSLDGGLDCRYRRDSFAILSQGQKQAVASFVFLFGVFGADCQAPYALKGLKRGWDAFVPEFLKLAIL